MLPNVPIEIISAMAAARFDCDWENVFKAQVRKITKATEDCVIKNLHGAHKPVNSGTRKLRFAQ